MITRTSRNLGWLRSQHNLISVAVSIMRRS